MALLSDPLPGGVSGDTRQVHLTGYGGGLHRKQHLLAFERQSRGSGSVPGAGPRLTGRPSNART